MRKEGKRNKLKLERIKITKLTTRESTKVFGGTQGQNGCGKTDNPFYPTCADHEKPLTPNCP